MGAGFSITIAAVDSATKRIDAVNKRLAAIRAPVEQLNKSLSTFGRLSGVTGIAKGFERIGRGAYAAFQSVARIVAPLSAITGAASLAGMYRMVEAWGQWGSQLGFTAQRIGITATALQAFQGAGLLAGSTADAMTTGLQALGQTMYDAIGGRAPETVALMNQLGVAFDDGTHHARNVTQVLPELADKIASIRDPYTQARVAQQLFGSSAESMLPFLRRGAKGIADLEERAKRYGVINQGGIDGANRMREAQANLTLAVTGLGNSISERLAPIIAPLLTQMADWIGKNRDWIATGIGGAVRDFATYLGQIDFKAVLRDLTGMWHTADGLAQSFGGWKNVIEALIALKLASWASGVAGGVLMVTRSAGALAVAMPTLTAALVAAGAAYLAYTRNAAAYDDYMNRRHLADDVAGERDFQQQRRAAMSPAKRAAFDALQAKHAGTIPYPGVTQLDMQKRAANMPGTAGDARAQALAFFRANGWSSAQAAGLVANLMSESQLNPEARGDGGSARGIGQWHPDRQANFARLFGHSVENGTLPEQLQFVQWELQNTEKGAGTRLRGATTPFEAGSAVSRFYERPGAVDEAATNRGNLAEQIALKDPPSNGNMNGKVDVHIKVDANGATTRTTAKGTGAANAPKVASTGVGTTGAT